VSVELLPYLLMNTSPEIQKPKRPRRWLKRLAWSVVWLVTLLALAVVVLNWKGARAWKAAVEEINAEGDSLDLASVVPPQVPDEENMASATIFAQLFESDDAKKQNDLAQPSLIRITPDPEGAPHVLAKNTGWRNGRPVDLKSWQTCYWENVQILKTNPKKAEAMPAVWKEHFKNSYWNGSPQAPAQDVLFALSAFEAELEQVREACERPQARFPLHYEKGVEMVMPYMPMCKLVRVVALKASAELALNQNEAALEDVLLAFRMADSIKSDPLLISYLIHLSIVHVAYEPLWTGIAKHHWNDQQLARLDVALSSLNLIEHLHLASRGDRNLSLVSLELNQRNPEFFKIVSGMTDDPEQTKWFIPWVRIVPQGWFDYNKVKLVQSWKESLGCSDLKSMRIFPERISALNPETKKPEASRFKINLFPVLTFGVIHSVHKSGAFVQSVNGLARIAIALERHFLKHGTYPENLAGLDESFSLKDGIPHDVATGNPPHYSRTSVDRFVLYYDGWNGKDDGGVTYMENGRVSYDYDKGDWVWPMPAEKRE